MRTQIQLPSRLTLAFTLALGLFAAEAQAQQLDLPRPSPLAKVSQVVGITEIAVEYSSPAVKGRKVWGDVVAMDKLWRTGANGATKITFSKDVMIADKPVPAGTYALFTIPGKDSWTVILNKNPNQGGTGDYKQELDLVRFPAKPTVIPNRERLTFLFDNTTDAGTTLTLEFEKLRVAMPIKANTDAQVASGIKALEDGSWRPYNSAARYLLDNKKEPERAMQLVDRSLSLHEDWYNVWTKAQLLGAKGKAAEACTLAQKAQTLGGKSPGFFAADDVKKALTDWKCPAR